MNMNKFALLTGGAVFALVASTQPSLAKTAKGAASDDVVSTTPYAQPAQAGPSNAELLARIEALEAAQEESTEKLQESQSKVSTLQANADQYQMTFDNSRPTFKTGDGRFSMAVRARFQFDQANFLQDVDPTTATNNTQFKDLSSGADVRRAFLGVEGKAFNDFWYELRLNLGGSDGGTNGVTEGDAALSLARVAYLGIDNFELNLGVIEPAFMFEGTTSSGQLMFLERPEIDNIAADAFGAGDARRGIEARFQKSDMFLGGDNLVIGGAFTGSKTGTNASHGNGGDEQSQILGRASYRFWSDGPSNAMIGVSGAKILDTGGLTATPTGVNIQDRPQVRVDGTRLISTGTIIAKEGSMYAFDAGANISNFYLGGEYAHFEFERDAAGARVADTPEFEGYYVEGSWVLTGEPKTYTVTSKNNEVGGFGAPKVARPFSLKGNSWGAWELVARYSDTDLNWNETRGPVALPATVQQGIAGGEEEVTALGVNWYLNQNVKLQLQDNIISVDKIASAGSAVQVGQDLNVVALRLQFTN